MTTRKSICYYIYFSEVYEQLSVFVIMNRFLIYLQKIVFIEKDLYDKSFLSEIEVGGISLDDRMILVKGKVVFKQYLLKKRHGAKFYILTKFDWIILNFTIYARVNDVVVLVVKIILYKTIMVLMRFFLNSWHSQYMDNFITVAAS